MRNQPKSQVERELEEYVQFKRAVNTTHDRNQRLAAMRRGRGAAGKHAASRALSDEDFHFTMPAGLFGGGGAAAAAAAATAREAGGGNIGTRMTAKTKAKSTVPVVSTKPVYHGRPTSGVAASGGVTSRYTDDKAVEYEMSPMARRSSDSAGEGRRGDACKNVGKKDGEEGGAEDRGGRGGEAGGQGGAHAETKITSNSTKGNKHTSQRHNGAKRGKAGASMKQGKALSSRTKGGQTADTVAEGGAPLSGSGSPHNKASSAGAASAGAAREAHDGHHEHRVCANHSFQGLVERDQLAFAEGDTLYVLDEAYPFPSGGDAPPWIWGQTEDGHLGYIPTAYIASAPSSLAAVVRHSTHL